ncbi:hypothetical protein [Eleftheria terrae]|uniref:hypothetical protein n=1 Tax=Eleftheria terrae TaxID=1597781 RepID=UPI00263B125B|nr:hypothetical protein [Eleftheria terrae]WKB55638.1 hypothetical protein N7L95_26560 [Eleftheria terrae]
MTVSVAGRPIQQASMLSAPCQQSLAFVDGGLQWLAWAAAAPVPPYEFADETTLVGAVQQGLHASRFALLPRLGLKVSPVKLMTLDPADLGLLARAQAGDPDAVLATQLRRLCADYELLTAQDLAAGTALLGELGVATAPLFQGIDFDEALALYQLAAEAPAGGATSALRQEAAAFAVEQARTPLEFCDYHRMYLERAAALPATQGPDDRARAATATLHALLPLLLGSLDCPQVDGLPAPAEVDRAVSSWLARGRQVGFARISLAVLQIVQHTHYSGEAHDGARDAVRLYLQSAQAFLAANRLGKGRLGQDGATCLFTVEAGNLRAVLQVSSGGVISLRDFGTRLPAVTDDTKGAS